MDIDSTYVYIKAENDDPQVGHYSAVFHFVDDEMPTLSS